MKKILSVTLAVSISPGYLTNMLCSDFDGFGYAMYLNENGILWGVQVFI